MHQKQGMTVEMPRNPARTKREASKIAGTILDEESAENWMLIAANHHKI